MSKQIFDFLFSLAALALLSPVLLLAALLVKLDSPGPVFFRQARVGRHGKEFRIYKFRTMRADSESAGPAITVGGDQRITRIGAFLRKYKIDEFPQFINVLLGDMSVVGPRPEVPRYVALYAPDVREIVLSVRPGVTDLASIEYRDENDLLAGADDPEGTYLNKIMPAKLDYYVRYVRDRSFLGDLEIIWRSAMAILGPR